MGQTRWKFKVRYSEHIHDIKQNSNKSKYAKCVLDHRHEKQNTSYNNKILKVAQKGVITDIYNKVLHTHTYGKYKQIIKNNNTMGHNVSFDLLTKQHENSNEGERQECL
jgi:hypothetical protein